MKKISDLFLNWVFFFPQTKKFADVIIPRGADNLGKNLLNYIYMYVTYYAVAYRQSKTTRRVDYHTQ